MKFFHFYVQGKSRKIQISKISNEQGLTLKEEAKIGKEAIRIFKEQFCETGGNQDYSILDCVPYSISYEESKEIIQLYGREEVK